MNMLSSTCFHSTNNYFFFGFALDLAPALPRGFFFVPALTTLPEETPIPENAAFFGFPAFPFLAEASTCLPEASMVSALP